MERGLPPAVSFWAIAATLASGRSPAILGEFDGRLAQLVERLLYTTDARRKIQLEPMAYFLL